MFLNVEEEVEEREREKKRERERAVCVEMSRRQGMIINGSNQLLDVPIVHCFLQSSFLLPKWENKVHKVYRHQNDPLFIYSSICTLCYSTTIW